MTKIKEGMRVKGKVEGRWYAGEVAHVYSSGKLKIKFNDGDVQVLSPEDVKIAGDRGGGGNTKKMKEGMRVRGKVDGEWYLGEIAKILSSGMVRVNFDDGDKLVLKPEDIKDARGRLGHENKESTDKIKKGSLVSYKGYSGEVIQLKEDEGMAKVRWNDGKSEWMDLDDLKLVDDLDWGEDLKKYNFRECTDQVTKIMGKRDLAPSEMVKKIVVYADKHATI